MNRVRAVAVVVVFLGDVLLAVAIGCIWAYNAPRTTVPPPTGVPVFGAVIPFATVSWLQSMSFLAGIVLVIAGAAVALIRRSDTG